MGYKIIDVEGIGPVYAEKLQAAGVNTTEDLLEKCAAKKGRVAMAEATGISEKLILKWTNHADLFRIKGIAGQFAELLEAAGVDTVKEFRHRVPASEDHTLFDVCADDHCQRYQGLARITDAAIRATAETRGQVLMYEGHVVDARFSKCCGGTTEVYETCWDNTPHPELASVSDYDAEDNAFCDTHDDALLRTILNNYDTSTHDFFQWEVRYTPERLSNLIKEKSGIDFGIITDLIPIERGVSGRISKLKIIGSHRTLIIGKELEIRRILSPTHLYSSNFIPTLKDGYWILNGRGWGHGVGMCQIGAAVMASRGYTCNEILHHYYPNTTLEKLWE